MTCKIMSGFAAVKLHLLENFLVTFHEKDTQVLLPACNVCLTVFWSTPAWLLVADCLNIIEVVQNKTFLPQNSSSTPAEPNWSLALTYLKQFALQKITKYSFAFLQCVLFTLLQIRVAVTTKKNNKINKTHP